MILNSIGNYSCKMETELSEWSETLGHLVKSTPWHISFCKYWYICKVLFTILFQKLKTNGKRKICKSITFVIMESYVHIKVNRKASKRCDGQSLCTFISHLVCSPWSYCHWASKEFHLYPDYISLSSDQMPFSRWHRVFHVGIG